MASKELPIFILWYDFTRWVFVKTEKFPRSVRFSFSNRINNLALDLVEAITEAQYSIEKANTLRSIDLKIERMRILLRLCHDLGYMDSTGWEFAARKLQEAGKMIGGWRRQQESRIL